MFDQELMDKVLKLLVKVRETQRVLEFMQNSDKRIYIVLEPDAYCRIESKLHYFSEFVNYEPILLKSLENFDKTNLNLSLWDFIDDFAAIYVVRDEDNLVYANSLKKELLINKENKNRILRSIDCDAENTLENGKLQKALKATKYKIKVLKTEIDRWKNK